MALEVASTTLNDKPRPGPGSPARAGHDTGGFQLRQRQWPAILLLKIKSEVRIPKRSAEGRHVL
jgi:hypothetical protein